MPDTTSAPGSKVCFICHQDCSARPRTKDAKGRYACKSCFDQAMAKSAPAHPPTTRPAAAVPGSRPAPSKTAVAAPPDEGDAVLNALIESEQSRFGPPCESCGIVLPKGTVVCTRCGYSRASGKAVKTLVVAAPRERDEPVGSKGRSSSGAIDGFLNLTHGPLGLVLAFIGGLIGAAMGAGVYVGVAYYADFEAGFIALACGFLAGAGVGLLCGDNAGILIGVMAAVLAVCGAFAGRYIAYRAVADRVLEPALSQIVVGEEEITSIVARQVHIDFRAKGTHYAFPEDVDPATAIGQQDFPKPIWDEAVVRTAALTPEERQKAFDLATAELERTKQDIKRGLADAAFSDSFNDESRGRRGVRTTFGVVFVGWLIVSACFAFGLGSRGTLSSD